MTPIQPDGKELLSGLGHLVAKRFDITIRNLKRKLTNREHPSDAAFHEHMDTLSNEERPVRIAQYALETFLHDMMASFDESETYFIFAKKAQGFAVNLKDFTIDSLHAETLDWLENFSENRTIHDIIYDISEKNRNV